MLNAIFSTHFEESQNKQAIVQGLPFISLRVFQNIFPLHVIDIAYDTPTQIQEEIVKMSNILLIHSWKSEEETTK